MSAPDDEHQPARGNDGAGNTSTSPHAEDGRLPTVKHLYRSHINAVPSAVGVASAPDDMLPGFKDQVRPHIDEHQQARGTDGAGNTSTSPHAKDGPLLTFKDQHRSHINAVPSAVGVAMMEEQELPTTTNEIPPVAVLEVLEEREDSTHRKHLIWAGAVVLVVAIVAVVVGVVVSTSNNSPALAPSAVDTTAPPHADVSSTFDNGIDGWSFGGDGVSLSDTRNGYISGTDGQEGKAWTFVAPAKFLGNLVGCSLSFELKQDSLDGQSNAGARIYIQSGTQLIAFRDGLPTPGLNFTEYEVALNPDGIWYDAATLALPNPVSVSSAVSQEILENVEHLAIQGEYSSTKDTGSLDNVYLIC